jgi:hypothetical protein
VEQKAKSRITKAYQKLQVQNCNFPTNLKIQTQKLKFSIVIPAKAGIQEPEVFVKKRKKKKKRMFVTPGPPTFTRATVKDRKDNHKKSIWFL